LSYTLELQLLALMVDETFVLIDVVNQEQQMYYWYAIIVFVVSLLLVALPLAILVFRKWSRSRSALSLIKEENYLVLSKQTK